MATKTLFACATDQQVRATVNEIDWRAQAALDEVVNLAELAALALNGREAGQSRIDPVAEALRSIADKAQRLRNDINAAAEDVGCNFSEDQPLPDHLARASGTWLQRQ